MKERHEDDRCIIPEEIKKMSNEELQKKIAQFEQAGKMHKTAQVDSQFFIRQIDVNQ